MYEGYGKCYYEGMLLTSAYFITHTTYYITQCYYQLTAVYIVCHCLTYFTMLNDEQAYTAALPHGRSIHSEHVTQNLFKHLIEAMRHMTMINDTKIFFDSDNHKNHDVLDQISYGTLLRSIANNSLLQ